MTKKKVLEHLEAINHIPLQTPLRIACVQITQAIKEAVEYITVKVKKS